MVTHLEMISAKTSQIFRGIYLILITEFYQFTVNFPRQSHFFGMCELSTKELAYPPSIL